MNKAQTAVLLHIIQTAYPSFGGSASSEDIASLWCEMLTDVGLEVASAAVKRHIQTNRFPPTVADIRTIITDMTMPSVTAGDIWQECYRLLNWNLGPEDEPEAYSHMSVVCREAVLAVGGWYALSMSPENDPFIRRTFMAAAEARIKLDRERGVTFDWSTVNRLAPCNDIPQLGDGADG